MTWLVTGGAGYIGSEITFQLLKSGRAVLVVDDLSTGNRETLPAGAEFIENDLRDYVDLRAKIGNEKIEGVIHAAGIKYAGESVRHPEEHYSRNMVATLSLLEYCREEGVKRFIFTSSSSVYGTPSASPVTENAPLIPESPYGRSKVAAEWLIRDFASAHGIQYTCLRFFNVVGVGGSGVADLSPFNLFPNLIRALQHGTEFELYGTDLDTPDGTCIRDYIHISDIANGHLAAIASWEHGRSLAHAYNLGLGHGISVREVMDEFEKVVGRSPAVRERPQRQGDPSAIWASNALALNDLAWVPSVPLHEIVVSCVRPLQVDSPGVEC